MEENKDLDIELQEPESAEELPKPDDSNDYYQATYVVYGMAAGLALGIVAMALFDSKLALSACVFLGTLIGYFIKKGDSNEK